MNQMQKIREEVQRLMNELIQEKERGYGSDVDDACILELQNVLTYIDSLQEEPVSEDLKAEIKSWLDEGLPNEEELVEHIKETACHFAKWQEKQDQSTIELAEDHAMLAGMNKMEQQMMSESNLWKSADNDDLPEIDREVIVLAQSYPLEGSEYTVSFAHRPKEHWDGKNIITGEVTHHYPKRYGKGGWNIPDVRYWLDCELPKMEENK